MLSCACTFRHGDNLRWVTHDLGKLCAVRTTDFAFMVAFLVSLCVTDRPFTPTSMLVKSLQKGTRDVCEVY